METVLILAVSLIISLAGPIEGAAQGDKLQLLLPGQYHSRDCSAVSGEKWWAVLMTQKGQELREVTLDVEPVHDSMIGDKENEKTGKLVSITEKVQGKCLFLVKGLKDAKTGPIQAFFSGEVPLWPRPQPNESYPPLCIRIDLGNNDSLLIRAHGSMKDSGTDYAINISEGPMLRLVEGNVQCVFESKTQFDYAVPQLLWVGDLDRDGEPDLLLDLTQKYVASLPTLFLSAARNPNEFVKQVAQILITGE